MKHTVTNITGLPVKRDFKYLRNAEKFAVTNFGCNFMIQSWY